MIFKRIEYGSTEYQLECALRNEVLRKPLGLLLRPEDLAKEKDDLHYGLLDGQGELLACLIATPLSSEEAKLRQMAVRADLQGQGHGRRLVEEVEKDLAARGFQRLQLNARLSAAGFYDRLGYTRTGPEFTEVTLPHVKMVKSL